MRQACLHMTLLDLLAKSVGRCAPSTGLQGISNLRLNESEP